MCIASDRKQGKSTYEPHVWTGQHAECVWQRDPSARGLDLFDTAHWPVGGCAPFEKSSVEQRTSGGDHGQWIRRSAHAAVKMGHVFQYRDTVETSYCST